MVFDLPRKSDFRAGNEGTGTPFWIFLSVLVRIRNPTSGGFQVTFMTGNFKG